jgi:hypothetical protein
MYEPSQAFKYIHARAPLTSFGRIVVKLKLILAAITVAFIVCTIAIAVICTLNFKKGISFLNRSHL